MKIPMNREMGGGKTAVIVDKVSGGSVCKELSFSLPFISVMFV